MKRLVVALLALAWSGWAQAYGLPYAVDTLKQAQTLSKQKTSMHVLVFYTSAD